MVAALQSGGQLGREVIGANEFGEGGVGGEVRDDDGGGDGFAVSAAHAGDFVVVDQDLLDLGAVADLAAAALEHLAQMLGERTDAAFELGHHLPTLFGHGEGEGEAGGATGGVGPAVGGVDGEEGEHAAHDGVLLFVGQVAVDDVHGGAEQRLVDGAALRFVCGAGVHLVDRLGRLADVEPAKRLGGALAPGDEFGHAHDGVGAVFLGEVGHQFHRVAVEDHGFFAGLADVDRHHVGVDGGQGVQAEVLGDLARGRELHGPGDLVAEAVDELDGGGHAAGIGVGLEDEGLEAGALEEGGGGESVVSGADDDRVIVTHGTAPYVSTDAIVSVLTNFWDTIARSWRCRLTCMLRGVRRRRKRFGGWRSSGSSGTGSRMSR